MAFHANNEHTKALIKTLAAQEHLLDLPRDTLQAIAAQQGAEFVKKLADECSSHANNTQHSRWRKSVEAPGKYDSTLDWPKFISELEFIAKLPTGPEHIFDSFVGFFNDQFHFFMADMSAEEFKKHAFILDNLILFMAVQQYKQKVEKDEYWNSEVWADELADLQDYYREWPLPGAKGHDDRELWAALFERSVRLLSK